MLFTSDEYAAVLRHADRLGVPLDEYIRRAVTVHPEGSGADTEGDEPRKCAAVPPVQRGLGGDGAPALQRFLDTLGGQDSEISGE
ncbi:hypothetical protein ACQB60_39245 [Actinomycetota bacterium Odt1-20B]